MKQSYSLVSAEELIKNIEPPQFLIHGFIPENALGMMHGVSGCGKTFIGIDIGYHIACSLNWHGIETKTGDIIYLAGEGVHGLKYRLLALKQYYSKDMDKIHILPHGCNLNKEDHCNATKEAIYKIVHDGAKPNIIFVDTLHRFFEGNENKAEDAKSLIDACDKLKDLFNCTVILIHHTGLSDIAQERARGSSAWRGAMDFEFNIRRDDEKLIMKCKKMKDFEEPKQIGFSFETVTLNNVFYSNGEAVKSIVLKCAGEVKETPKVTTKDKKFKTQVSEGMDIIRDVSKQYGKVYDGKYCIKQKEFISYLIEYKGKTKNQANDMAKSDDNRLIGKLIKAGILEKITMDAENYFQIIDEDFNAEIQSKDSDF